MVLIISKSSDTTTEQVAEWLDYFEVPFYVLNDNLYEKVKIDYINDQISIDGISLSQFNVVWFRKYPEIFNESEKNFIHKKLYKSIIQYGTDEAIAFREYLFFSLKRTKIKWLTKPFSMNQNKAIQMKMALDRKILTPNTYIVNSKKEILELISDGKEYITKPFENCINIRNGSQIIPMKTVVINKHIRHIPEFFRPALIQERIIKKFEVRIFFLLGKFYATKIVDDDNSEVDHRVSILDKNGRFEVFILPREIEKKLFFLMCDMDLNCASIDMIINEKDEFIFLEVNPTGQFTYHSVFNNMYLEIAKALKKMNNEKE